MKGDVPGSLLEFDKAIELDPRQKACKLLKFSFPTRIMEVLFYNLLLICKKRTMEISEIDSLVIRSLAKGAIPILPR